MRHRGAARQPDGARRGVARARRTRERCTCSTPTSRRTRRGIATSRRACTAAIARRACSRKSCSASAACARSGRWACEPARLPPQRGACRVRRSSAHPRSLREGVGVRRRARRGAPHHRVHHAHAGGRRPRRVPVPHGRSAPVGRVGRSRRLPGAILRAGPLRQRRRRHVQHDRAGAANGRRRQRRQPAARRSDQADVAVDLARTPPSKQLPIKSITNGVHVPTWMSSEIGALLEKSPRAPTGSTVTTIRRSAIAVLRDSRRGAVGRRASRCATFLFNFIRERARHRWTHASASPPRGSSRPARCSTTTR